MSDDGREKGLTATLLSTRTCPRLIWTAGREKVEEKGCWLLGVFYERDSLKGMMRDESRNRVVAREKKERKLLLCVDYERMLERVLEEEKHKDTSA